MSGFQELRGAQIHSLAKNYAEIIWDQQTSISITFLLWHLPSSFITHLSNSSVNEQDLYKQ